MTCFGQNSWRLEQRAVSCQTSCKHFSEMFFCEFGEGGLDPCSQLHKFFFFFYCGCFVCVFVYLCECSHISRWTCLFGWKYLPKLFNLSRWRTLKRMLVLFGYRHLIKFSLTQAKTKFGKFSAYPEPKRKKNNR